MKNWVKVLIILIIVIVVIGICLIVNLNTNNNSENLEVDNLPEMVENTETNTEENNISENEVSSQTNTDSTNNISTSSATTSNNNGNNNASTNSNSNANSDTNKNSDTNANSDTDKNSNAIKTTTNLTKSELDEIESYLNKTENNGFVSPFNTYSNPNEINLHVIFYDAFTLPQGNSSLSEDELNAYKATGRPGNTDIRKVTTAQAEQRFLEKTGEPLTNLKSRLSWVYLEKYDAYYTEGGDTGMVNVVALSGVKNHDGTYVVNINAGDTDETVTLKKSGGNYLFVSNIAK